MNFAQFARTPLSRTAIARYTLASMGCSYTEETVAGMANWVNKDAALLAETAWQLCQKEGINPLFLTADYEAKRRAAKKMPALDLGDISAVGDSPKHIGLSSAAEVLNALFTIKQGRMAQRPTNMTTSES